MDCMDGLALLPDSSVDVVITSPPYNKAGLNGKRKPNPDRKWGMTIDYGGDMDSDCMDEGEYRSWQLSVLSELSRVLKGDGSVFYIHKNRIHRGVLVSPLEWLLKSDLTLRQEIIWDRGSSNVVNTCRWIPTTERIYWLTKGVKPSFKRLPGVRFKGEVWSFGYDHGNAHPAPFPESLCDVILSCIPDSSGGRKLVLDPFMGSGTVGVCALRRGFDYIGFEKVHYYADMSNRRINGEVS